MEKYPATFSPRKNKSNRYCCVPQCNSKACRDITVRFHKFPKDSEIVTIEDNFGGREKCSRRKLWIHRLKIGKSISKNMSVCSKHFQRSDYILPDVAAKNRFLKKTAVPSLNLPKSTTDSLLCVQRKREREQSSMMRRNRQPLSEGGNQEISSIGSSNYHSKNNVEQHSNASTKANVEGSEFTTEYYVKEEIDETSDIQEENQTDDLRDPLSLDPHIEECYQNEILIKKEFPDTYTEEQPNSNSSVPWNPSDVIIQNIESLIKKEFPDTCVEEQP